MAHSLRTKTSNWLHSLGRSWQAASLRSKTKLIIAAALVGMLLLALVPLRMFVLQSFAELERREAGLDAERTLNALDNLFAELERITNDYAAWTAPRRSCAGAATPRMTRPFPRHSSTPAPK